MASESRSISKASFALLSVETQDNSSSWLIHPLYKTDQ